MKEKKTSPSARFTYAALLGAMNSIHLHVEEPEIRKQFKELDGIGTSATQENILEKRKKGRGGAQIFSTTAGRALIDILNGGGKSTAFAAADLTAL